LTIQDQSRGASKIMIPVDQINSCQSALPALHPRTSISAFQLEKKADASKRTERRVGVRSPGVLRHLA
jgi:hypothetical protein